VKRTSPTRGQQNIDTFNIGVQEVNCDESVENEPTPVKPFSKKKKNNFNSEEGLGFGFGVCEQVDDEEPYQATQQEIDAIHAFEDA